MKTPFTIAAVLLILPSAFVMSQRKQISLDDAVKMAIANNRELQVAKLEMEKADARVREAIGYALPSVIANGTYTRSLEKPVFFLPDFENPESGRVLPIEIGSDNALQFGFQAQQILFNAAVFTGVGTAKVYQRASREAFRNSYNATIAQVKRAFYGTLFIQDVTELSRASLKNAEENLKNVVAFNKQGIVSDYDLIRAEVQVENIRPSVLEAERNVVASQNNLKVLLGLSPNEDVSVVGQLTYEPVEAELVENAEEMLLAKNASLKALELQSQVNQELVSIYRAEFLPTLSAFGSYQWQTQKNDFRISTNDFVRSAQIGLSLNISLFNGFQTSSRIDQAQVDYIKSQTQLSAVRDAFLTQAQNIRLRLEEAQKRIEAQRRTVEQAEKGYKIATTRYSAGTGTQLEINDADLALLRARINRVQAVYDYNVAKTDLEELISVLQPES